jgi:hypothetical protein
LSNITGTTPSTKLDTSSWQIPKDIKLADEQFDQPGSIDLLIGADLFYEILLPGRRTRPGNYPVLQETFLGWTLSGRTPTPSTQEEPQHTFLLREDNSLEHNLNRFWEVETMEQSTMTTEINSPTDKLEIRNVHGMSTTSRRHHPEILQVKQTHQSHCLLQKIHTPLQTTHGQQASNHSLRTRSGPGSDLLCEDGTAEFFRTRNQGFNGTTRGCIQQFSQDTAPIHR